MLVLQWVWGAANPFLATARSIRSDSARSRTMTVDIHSKRRHHGRAAGHTFHDDQLESLFGNGCESLQDQDHKSEQSSACTSVRRHHQSAVTRTCFDRTEGLSLRPMGGEPQMPSPAPMLGDYLARASITSDIGQWRVLASPPYRRRNAAEQCRPSIFGLSGVRRFTPRDGGRFGVGNDPHDCMDVHRVRRDFSLLTNTSFHCWRIHRYYFDRSRLCHPGACVTCRRSLGWNDADPSPTQNCLIGTDSGLVNQGGVGIARRLLFFYSVLPTQKYFVSPGTRVEEMNFIGVRRLPTR